MTKYLKPNDGGRAFPGPLISGGDCVGHSMGLTLRDWFAGQIISGLCADPSSHKTFGDETDAAQSAYVIADAMIAARNEKVKP